jgi:pSer/pThr/pTyr-binding forkhead associated (FHA) protein
MTELWLNYTDEKGEEKRLLVEQEKFAVGRHSDNDLSFANSAVSRQHVKIERFGDVFVISDVGSSLGTKINGTELVEPVALNKGDKINLGGEFEIEVELISDEDKAAASAGNESGNPGKDENQENNSGGSASVSSAAAAKASGSGSSIPTSFFYIAPLIGIVALLSIGGILIATGGGSEKKDPKSNEYVYSNERRNSTPLNREDEEILKEKTPKPIETNQISIENTIDTPNVSTPEETNSQPSPRISGELEKVEVNSISFLRQIAQSRQGAFLTGKQQEIIQSKINQFKNSTALADNLKSAKKNEAAIKSLASSKNLKPQLLTVAALARLGNNRGDVLQTAQSMAEVLDDLTRNIGDERSDDALLIIAAFQQGASGDTLGLRNKLQSLVNESPNSSRQIRTIWYLRDKNHITEAEFESALQFLAVGTISQNPKEFGVNAEAINF